MLAFWTVEGQRGNAARMLSILLNAANTGALCVIEANRAVSAATKQSTATLVPLYGVGSVFSALTSPINRVRD